MKSLIPSALILCLVRAVPAAEDSLMVTRTGSGVSHTGRSVGMLKMYGMCDGTAAGQAQAPAPAVHHGLAFAQIESTETYGCRADTWVGPFGMMLSQSVASDPEATRHAAGFRRWSFFKAASMVAMPVFLIAGINMMNEDTQGEDGEHDPGKSPRGLSIAVTSGALAGFLGYVVADVMERNRLGKVRDAWNARTRASFRFEPESLELRASRDF